MRLSEQQISFFNLFGYLVVEQLFTPAEMEVVTEAFEWSVRTWGGGDGHDGRSHTMMAGAIEHSPELCSLLDHPDLLGLISGIIGNDFNYCGGDGNLYSGDTLWHSDAAEGHLWVVKVAVYLDSLKRNKGCLYVLPGSHNRNHFIRREQVDPSRLPETLGVNPVDLPGAVAIETNPGDVVLFNHDLYHGSFGGENRRRMFTMNCTRRAVDPEGMARLRAYLKRNSPGAYDVDTAAGMFFPTILDTADAERMVHLEQPAQIHDELFPHLAREVGEREPFCGNVASPFYEETSSHG